MPETMLRGKRAVAVVVAATLVGVSAAVLLSGQNTTARAAAAPGATVRASVSEDGERSGGAYSELSANGTTVVFSSYRRLDELSNGENEAVYVRDLRSGRTVMISRGQFTRPEPEPETPVPTTTTTTTTTTTVPTFEPPRLAGEPLVSLNGRRQPSPAPAPEFGEAVPTGSSSDPTVSADGRFVAFTTQADNILVEDDDTYQDLLVCDRDPDGDGEFDELREDGGLDYRYFRVNEPQWEQGEGGLYRTDSPDRPRLSDDASRVVWEDETTDDNGDYHRIVRTATVTPAGTGPAEDLGTSLGELSPVHQEQPDVSSDGRFVVLVADYVRYVGGGEFPTPVPFHAVVRKDTVTGSVARVDLDEGTTPEEPLFLSEDQSVHLARPAISGDGGTIAFEAEAYQDYCSEGTCWYSVADQPTTYVVRVREDGTAVDSAVASRDNEGEAVNGFRPALSGDGRFLAFVTDNAGAHDGLDTALDYYDDSCLTNSDSGRAHRALPPVTEERSQRVVCQVVVRDLVVDRERARTEQPRLPGTLASPGTGRDCAEEVPEDATCGGNDNSPPYGTTAPSLSANGSTVAYDSDATDLVPDLVDDNEYTDVFVRTFRPELRADPTPLEFGEVTIGETLDLVTRLDHVGFGPLVVTELVVDGPFSVGAQTCTGEETVVLQQTGSCEVSVTFAPTEEGERTGTLVIRLRDGREFTVPVRGTGAEEELPPPDDARFAASPDPLDFGDRLLLSDAPARTVTVTNTGGSDLTVDSVAVVAPPLAPPDYTIESDTCTDTPVPPDGTCQVAVRFSPQGSGARAAVLRFTDDIPGGTPHLIGLAGTGSTPAVEVSPGVTQPGRAIVVSGTGYAPGRQITIAVTGSVEKATVVPAEDGTFSKVLLILPKSPIGTHPVVATIDGTDPAIAAAKPLLIVSPSVSPADFVVRN